ncbi:hypothetical protein [Nocardia macrotermitis]|uniref:Uncharacterized protein n=1 Tax=Nocardia macrotermitis TaxID=2585198 RepID=A0A7K0CXG7_9NOCA|nr:hypothetical protein [Nocardia macrotermitis]
MLSDGLSWAAMRQLMGVDEPDYGHLLGELEVFENTPVDTSKYLCPRVEVEVGFVPGRGMSAMPSSTDSALSVCVCTEEISSE